MTKAQVILKKWINKNFEKDHITVTFASDNTAVILDKNGDKMTITMNLYCDILEEDTRKILAVSDLPHSLEDIGTLMPQSWTEMPY